MLTTIEMRWFYRGTVPQEISSWFETSLGSNLASPEEREDLYLYVPKCEYLGIKLRQGQLEMKWRKAELGVSGFGDRVEGKAEQWSKWICEDPTGETFNPSDVMDKGAWLAVQKVRSQRQYQVLPEQSFTVVPATQPIAQGCDVELTQLNINNHAWWSLAFESFGKDDCLMDNFRAVANWVFKDYCSSKLQDQDSYAYPTWLALVDS